MKTASRNGSESSAASERLGLVEDREAELLAAPLAPAPAQLLVARVLALAGARSTSDAMRRFSSPTMTAISTRCESVARAEDGVEHRDSARLAAQPASTAVASRVRSWTR